MEDWMKQHHAQMEALFARYNALLDAQDANPTPERAAEIKAAWDEIERSRSMSNPHLANIGRIRIDRRPPS